MDELYSIMSDFLEVKYNQESLLCVLTALEAAYNDESQIEVKYIVNSIKFYLEALQKESITAINKLDIYILEEVKKER